MRRESKDALQAQLDRELAACASDAMQADGGISAERMAALERLARLVELRNAAQPVRRSLWVAGALLATLTIVSLLLFTRVRTTDIETEITATEVSFTLAKDQVVNAALDLAGIGLSGEWHVQLPPFGSTGQDTADNADLPTAIALAPSKIEDRHGSVTLTPLRLPAGTRMTIRRSDLWRQYRVSIEGNAMQIEAVVYGPVTAMFAGSQARTFEAKSPRAIIAQGGPHEVDLDLTFVALPQSPFAPQLEVRDLSLSRIDEYPGQDTTLIRRVSTIVSGKLYLESLDGQERTLRSGETLVFADSRGEMRSVVLTRDALTLKFHGRVSGMRTGTGEAYRSLMPTWLDWLQARHGLALLWGTTLYVFGLALAVLRWWGIRL
jgi:hypothetical protein